MTRLPDAGLYVLPCQSRRASMGAALCFGGGMLLFAAQRHWLGLDATAMPTALRGCLPSFIHTYVFVLLAGIWLARSWPQVIALGLTFWAVDVTLEVLQQPAAHETLHIPRMFRRALTGTFDPLDLLAMSLGLLAAWASLAKLSARR